MPGSGSAALVLTTFKQTNCMVTHPHVQLFIVFELQLLVMVGKE